MSKYVPDISSKRWVIISPQRINRPHKRGEKFICPFCPGNEAMTTEEVMRVGKGEPNKPGWEIRVIPNKYPITDFWKGYSGLVDVGYGRHIRLNHKKGVWTDGRGHI